MPNGSRNYFTTTSPLGPEKLLMDGLAMTGRRCDKQSAEPKDHAGPFKLCHVEDRYEENFRVGPLPSVRECRAKEPKGGELLSEDPLGPIPHPQSGAAKAFFCGRPKPNEKSY